MVENLVEHFLGGNADTATGPEVHGQVDQMLQSAPDEHGLSAISESLGALGSGGFGQSIEQAATTGGTVQRSDIAGLLMGAIEQGGGSPHAALQQLGMGGQDPQSLNPQQLGQLADHVQQNHPNGLMGMLTSQMGGGSGGSSGILSLLGTPMVRQIGMNLAKKML